MIRNTVVTMLAAIMAVVASPALAQDDPALKAAVESYVGHPVTQRTLDGLWSMETLRSHLVTQFHARNVKLRSDQMETATQIVLEELHRLRPQLESLMVDAAIETFSLEEIQALNDFLNTEFGASATLKMDSYVQSFNAGFAPMSRELFERVSSRVDSELPE